MLERLSSYLLRSVENLANEELEYKKPSEGDLHVYYPFIVTNATLLACRYDVNDVEISTGHLTKAEFEEVPYIRFRKNLSSSVKTKDVLNIKQANSDYERTVFVVNSNRIIETLKHMELPYKINAQWPWDNFR